MNALAWQELYEAFAAFAYIARRQGFYVGALDKMEHSLFDMCPYPRSFRPNKKGVHRK